MQRALVTAVVLGAALALNIHVTLASCTCANTIGGHWYPAAFIVFLGVCASGENMGRRLNVGMIMFGLVYVAIDMLQGVRLWRGDASTKIIQHWFFTLTVSFIGTIRSFHVPHSATVFAEEWDKLLLGVLIFLFVVFMANHPQPNKQGDWMHCLTAWYMVLFFVFGATAQPRRATCATMFAATCFLFSQEGLTTAADAARIDIVAYACIVHAVALAVVVGAWRGVEAAEKA
jgi:hypothetical protein